MSPIVRPGGAHAEFAADANAEQALRRVSPPRPTHNVFGKIHQAQIELDARRQVHPAQQTDYAGELAGDPAGPFRRARGPIQTSELAVAERVSAATPIASDS